MATITTSPSDVLLRAHLLPCGSCGTRRCCHLRRISIPGLDNALDDEEGLREHESVYLPAQEGPGKREWPAPAHPANQLGG